MLELNAFLKHTLNKRQPGQSSPWAVVFPEGGER